MNNLLDITPPVNTTSNISAGEVFLVILFFAAIIAFGIISIYLLAKFVAFLIKKTNKKKSSALPSDGLDDIVDEEAPTASSEETTDPKEADRPKQRGKPNAFLIVLKLLTLVCIVFFALINYRMFSLDRGFSKTSDNHDDPIQAIQTYSNISKIEYYERTFSDDDGTHRIFISTSTENYLFYATENDIKALSTLGIFSKSLTPQKITPIPFYVEIIVGFIILIIPTRIKR